MGTEDYPSATPDPATKPVGLGAIVVVLVRMMGVFLAIYGVVVLSAFIGSVLSGSVGGAPRSLVLVGVCLIAFGLLFWFLAKPVAARVTRDIDPTLPACPLELPDIYAVAIVFLSLILLADNIDSLLHALPSLMSPPLDGGRPMPLLHYTTGMTIGYIVADCMLIAYARRLGRLLATFQGWPRDAG